MRKKSWNFLVHVDVSKDGSQGSKNIRLNFSPSLLCCLLYTGSLLRVTLEGARLHGFKSSRRDSVFSIVLKKNPGLSFFGLTPAKCPFLSHHYDHMGQNKLVSLDESHPNHMDWECARSVSIMGNQGSASRRTRCWVSKEERIFLPVCSLPLCKEHLIWSPQTPIPILAGILNSHKT